MGKMTNTATQNYRIQLDLPPVLYRRLASEASRRSATLDQTVRQALERYAEAEGEAFDITQTRTWQLCGTLEMAEADPEYVVRHYEQGAVVTDYAERADNLLYRGRRCLRSLEFRHGIFDRRACLQRDLCVS